MSEDEVMDLSDTGSPEEATGNLFGDYNPPGDIHLNVPYCPTRLHNDDDDDDEGSPTDDTARYEEEEESVQFEESSMDDVIHHLPVPGDTTARAQLYGPHPIMMMGTYGNEVSTGKGKAPIQFSSPEEGSTPESYRSYPTVEEEECHASHDEFVSDGEDASMTAVSELNAREASRTTMIMHKVLEGLDLWTKWIARLTEACYVPGKVLPIPQCYLNGDHTIITSGATAGQLARLYTRLNDNKDLWHAVCAAETRPKTTDQSLSIFTVLDDLPGLIDSSDASVAVCNFYNVGCFQQLANSRFDDLVTNDKVLYAMQLLALELKGIAMILQPLHHRKLNLRVNFNYDEALQSLHLSKLYELSEAASYIFDDLSRYRLSQNVNDKMIRICLQQIRVHLAECLCILIDEIDPLSHHSSVATKLDIMSRSVTRLLELKTISLPYKVTLAAKALVCPYHSQLYNPENEVLLQNHQENCIVVILKNTWALISRPKPSLDYQLVTAGLAAVARLMRELSARNQSQRYLETETIIKHFCHTHVSSEIMLPVQRCVSGASPIDDTTLSLVLGAIRYLSLLGFTDPNDVCSGFMNTVQELVQRLFLVCSNYYGMSLHEVALARYWIISFNKTLFELLFEADVDITDDIKLMVQPIAGNIRDQILEFANEDKLTKEATGLLKILLEDRSLVEFTS